MGAAYRSSTPDGKENKGQKEKDGRGSEEPGASIREPVVGTGAAYRSSIPEGDEERGERRIGSSKREPALGKGAANRSSIPEGN